MFSKSEAYKGHSQSHLEVINEPDLLHALVRRKPDPTAPEDEVTEPHQLRVLLDEQLDSLPVLVERLHEEFLEVDELVDDVQLVSKLAVELFRGCSVYRDSLLLFDPVSTLVKDLRRHVSVKLEQKVSQRAQILLS